MYYRRSDASAARCGVPKNNEEIKIYPAKKSDHSDHNAEQAIDGDARRIYHYFQSQYDTTQFVYTTPFFVFRIYIPGNRYHPDRKYKDILGFEIRIKLYLYCRPG